jgi:hypothetical protein
MSQLPPSEDVQRHVDPGPPTLEEGRKAKVRLITYRLLVALTRVCNG